MREVVRRLRAYESGGPLPRYSSKHLSIHPDPMVVAFIRMAGESRPWGIAFGPCSASGPTILSVPDGRHRQSVNDMCEEFAHAFLPYMRAEGYSFDPITKDNVAAEGMPQVWVPGAKHVEMFHHLEYAYWRLRKGDDRATALSGLARLSGWMFRESSVVGQQVIIDASAALRDAYAFPCDDYSLGHLGASVSWLTETGPLEARRLAARDASSRPVSPTLDPDLDRRRLSGLVDRYNDPTQPQSARDSAAESIADCLQAELVYRWRLTRDAHALLANDVRPENAGVGELVRRTWLSYDSQFQRLERQAADPDLGPAFTPHPETDFHGAAAASSYFDRGAADSAYLATLIHDDEELLAEAIVNGTAFRATVVDVEDRGVGRSKAPHWRLYVPLTELLRIREGERYAPLGAAGHTVAVREIEELDEDGMTIVVEWIDRKTKEVAAPRPDVPLSLAWRDETVVFVPKDSSTFERAHSRQVWAARDGVGAWLTHGRAPSPIEPNVVDDVTQLGAAQ